MKYPVIKISGDQSLTLVFGDAISEEINARIRAYDRALQDKQIPGIVETVPTYCALTVHYRAEIIRYRDLQKILEELLLSDLNVADDPAIVIEIPVCYGGEYGPDLTFVAEHAGKHPEEVVKIHADGDYLIYMLGFTPGFAYMGGMDASIAAPRLQTPRVKIPAGAVGIAGQQTGIYPMDSPGGWQLIGRTPVKLYDADREKPILLDAGMRASRTSQHASTSFRFSCMSSLVFFM